MGNAPSSSARLPAIDLRGRKILVADDGMFNVRVLGHILTREGYVLKSAGSRNALLSLYPEFQPDLILLDAELPGDGVEACRTLKQTYGAQCAAIMFLTAKATSDDIVVGLEAGATDYLRKPFNRTEVIARIRSQLRNRFLVTRRAAILADLDRANSEKNRLLNLAAQDLRTPLASICELAQFLRGGTLGALPPDQQDLVDTIHTTSNSMLGMLEEMLDVASIESGEMKLARAPTDLGMLLDRAIDVANMSAGQKQSRILLTTPLLNTLVAIDAAKMKQVIDNLLSNAVKYSPPGSIVIAELHLTPSRGGFTFSVRDQGPGIPEHERHKLFKDFGRLSAKPTAGEKSTGLGLAICQKIVAAHGGTITVENHPEGGAEFCVTIPPPV